MLILRLALPNLNNSSRGVVVRFVTLSLMILFAGCSSLPADQVFDTRDPYEDSNRSVFDFNVAVDTAVIEPLARGYRSLPGGVQTALTNHAQWTSFPSTAVNSALQGKFENAALATVNFLVNGLALGFIDLTDDADDPIREDFGQTLDSWTVPQGSYIMMPLLGPGTVRSHVGFLVDAVTNPLSYSGQGGIEAIQYTSTPIRVTTSRGNNFDQINDIKYNAADPYAKTRALYFQFRENQLNDGDPLAPSDADTAFDDFLSDEN